MGKEKVEHQDLTHVKNISELEYQAGADFNLLVGRLLEGAPNVARITEYVTDYDKQPPTDQAVGFKLRNSTIRASYYVGLGMPPTYCLEIINPIAVDNLEPDGNTSKWHPLDPHEIVEFKSMPYFKSLTVDAKAVSCLGDFGREITLEQYTAGGLLPPINVLGKGKIDVFKSVTTLFKGVIPQNPTYKQTSAIYAPSVIGGVKNS
ncbi:MAG: hypothetical protein HW400_626 [Candidatus Levybacteria bacterium]|nr:hypothetical protein [Candidatus Levybacteria bacterium]